MAWLVAKKVAITFVIAVIGSILALVGGRIDDPLTLLGLLLVVLSPIISYLIVLRDVKKLPPKEPPKEAKKPS